MESFKATVNALGHTLNSLFDGRSLNCTSEEMVKVLGQAVHLIQEFMMQQAEEEAQEEVAEDISLVEEVPQTPMKDATTVETADDATPTLESLGLSLNAMNLLRINAGKKDASPVTLGIFNSDHLSSPHLTTTKLKANVRNSLSSVDSPCLKTEALKPNDKHEMELLSSTEYAKLDQSLQREFDLELLNAVVGWINDLLAEKQLDMQPDAGYIALDELEGIDKHSGILLCLMNLKRVEPVITRAGKMYRVK